MWHWYDTLALMLAFYAITWRIDRLEAKVKALTTSQDKNDG